MKKRVLILCVVLFVVAYGAFIWERDHMDTSDHYINSLYKSDERIYYNELGEDDRAMYDLLIDSSLKHKTSITIDMDKYHCVDYSDCGDIIHYANDALSVDHPELMNYAGYSWHYNNGKFVLRLYPAYTLSYKDYYGVWKTEKILKEIEKDTEKMSDKEKIIYVYNWVGSHNDYDYYFTYTSKNQSIYNVFVKKNAVCAGFAKASQIIFQRIGIESYIVSGSSEDYHMWNIVKYEDRYYYYDSTVAVGFIEGTEHYYEGLKQEYMNYYVVTHPDWYPPVETTNMFEI